MSRSHGPRRARVEYTELVEDQVAKLTAAELHRLDRAVVAVSVDPEIGAPSRHPALRDYRDEIEGVRIVYYVTAMRLVLVLAYVEA
jgi:mRNA-degrading endonuclease RelE of RelBE toxin-antitoxin system